MKNIFPVSVGIIISIALCTIFFNISKPDNTEPVIANNEIKAFQIGAFKDSNGATTLANNNNGVVIKDNDYYLVYVGILKDSENIKRLMEYLNDKNIYYYIKTITLDTTLEEELLKYEEMMKKTSSDVAFIKLNKKILDFIGEKYES